MNHIPTKNKRLCCKPGCTEKVEAGYCRTHEKQRRAQKDRFRGTAAERGYDARWRAYRALFLQQYPLCKHCLKDDVYTPAEVVDHITPHRMDMVLFWDPNNHQPLCKRHHDIKTATEDGGFGR
ncbi:Holin protein [Paenibacillus sp. P22]|nr:Holin protein [Paenibacillus sp. P22]